MRIKLNTTSDVKNFVLICEKHKECSVDVKQGRWVIDGKSILGIFSLDLMQSLDVIINSKDKCVKEQFYEDIAKWEIEEQGNDMIYVRGDETY